MGFRLFDIILFCLLVMITITCGRWTENRDMPNVLIIYADDLGYGDLSSYGGDIDTPHIDRIGESGIRFTDFYVSNPACTPSRYSLLTGSYPQRSRQGLHNVLMPREEYHFSDREVTLAELLKTQGYRTAIIGKWHLGGKETSYLPMNHGFDEFAGFRGGCIDYFCHVYGSIGHDWYVDGEPAVEEGYSTDLITNHAVDFIDRATREEKPFFLYLPYNAPHYGKTDPDSIPDGTFVMSEGEYQGFPIMNTLQAPEKYIEQFRDVEDSYRRYYSAMVASLDDNVGRVLAKLEEESIVENTMVWFISDNGGYSESYNGHSSNGRLRGEKGTLWEGGIRVPAMVSWRSRIDSGQVNGQVLSTLDIVPTLGRITGYGEKLSGLPIDGVDISGVLFDGETIERDIFWRYRGRTALRRGNWKLMNGEQLFNLRSDIGEKTDVSAANSGIFKELTQVMDSIDASISPYEVRSSSRVSARR